MSSASVLAMGAAAAAAVQLLLVLQRAALRVLPGELAEWAAIQRALGFLALSAGALLSEDCGNPVVGYALAAVRGESIAGLAVRVGVQAAAAASVLLAVNKFAPEWNDPSTLTCAHPHRPRNAVLMAEMFSTAAAVALIGIYVKKYRVAADLPAYVAPLALALAAALWGGTCNDPGAAVAAFVVHRQASVLQATLIGCVTGTTLCLLLVLRVYEAKPLVAASGAGAGAAAGAAGVPVEPAAPRRGASPRPHPRRRK